MIEAQTFYYGRREDRDIHIVVIEEVHFEIAAADEAEAIAIAQQAYIQ